MRALVLPVALVLVACSATTPSPSMPPAISSPRDVSSTTSSAVTPNAMPTPAVSPAAQGGPGDLEEARRRYPPEITRGVLEGAITAPAGLAECLNGLLGPDRVVQLREKLVPVDGRDNDRAAECLVQVGATLAVPSILPQTFGPTLPGPGRSTFTIERPRGDRASEVPAATPAPSAGRFRTGQAADLLLAGDGLDFDRTGGGLSFNHPAGIASDGRRLILADAFNNRVLIWNDAPTRAVLPDVVLGQPDLGTNRAGSGRDGLNWPLNLTTDGRRLIVADTSNDRVLIWNEIPTRNATPADIVLAGDPRPGIDRRGAVLWPWGVWSDGTRLAVSSTLGSQVLLWDRFPTRDGQPPDRVLTAGGRMGTPRHITSDGRALMVGDHNPRVGNGQVGAFVWTSFPTGEEDASFFLPSQPWARGSIGPDGRAWIFSQTFGAWRWPLSSAGQPADLMLQPPCSGAGDYESVAFVGERLYVACGNDNRVVGYERMPTADARPTIVLGAPDLETNTLLSRHIVQNGALATDGRSLFAASDFDRRLSIWSALPKESGTPPDLVYRFGEFAPWDIALHGDRLVLAGKDSVWVWTSLARVRAGASPDRVYQGRVGSVAVRELRGVALDAEHLYLSDAHVGRVYVFSGLPEEGQAPKATLELEAPQRIASDGEVLLVTSQQTLLVYRVSRLGAGTAPGRVGGVGRLNLPQMALTVGRRLFIADTAFARVLIWDDIDRALSGQWPPDAILGQKDAVEVGQAIGRDRLFSPASLAWDGEGLWVAEIKFSNRIVRFRPVTP